MKAINKLADRFNRINAKRNLTERLAFYKELTMYNAHEFKFEEINEILDIKQQLKTI
jgi:hypothetical protein